MSATFCKITAIGNLGRDPEMRFTPSGTEVCSFSVAATRSYMKGEEKVEETIWLRVTTWGKQAINCNKYLKKGSKVYIEGRLTPDKAGNPRIWEKSDGTPGASFEVNASEVMFLTTRGDGGAEESVSMGEQGEEIPF
jgi:single-strand DNA-binding protein